MSYAPSEGTRTITVQAVTVTLGVSPPSGMLGDTFTFTGTVTKDTTGIPAYVEIISPTLGVVASGHADETGAFSLDWIADAAGTLDFYAEASGLGWSATSPTVTITVTKIFTELTVTVPPAPLYIGVPFMVTGALLEGVPPLVGIPGETITVSYNGVPVGTVFTASDGSWAIDVTIPTLGTYRITASWPGDDTHEAASVVSPSFAIELIPTALTIDAPATVIVGAPFTISGVLTRVDTGAGLSGETIDVSYDTVIIDSVATAADGSYSIETSIPTAGTYRLKAAFPGGASMAAAHAEVGIVIGEVAPPVVVCANYPYLKELYRRATERNMTFIMERIKGFCERLDTLKG